jgi:hypothetical protein
VKLVPHILQELARDPELIERMQANLLQVYGGYLSSVERFVLAAFDLVVHHLYESHVTQLPLNQVSFQVQRVIAKVIQTPPS